MVKNVLVAPLLTGKKEAEWKRMERILRLSDAQRVHVIRQTPEEPRYAESPRHVHDQLSEMADNGRLELEAHYVDLFDVEQSMTILAKLADQERGSDVVYSLATGHAPGAMVGTLACVVWPWRGLYVGGTPPKEIVAWVPAWLRAEQVLTDDELRVLRILSGAPDGLTKKALIDQLQATGRIRRAQEKGAYRRLAARFLKRLEEYRLITVGPRDGFDGRQHYVVATDEGLRAFRIFGPTLREPAAAMHLRGGKAESQELRF